MLVGRAEERRRLSGTIASARLGQGAVLLLTGEPGAGKTTLLEATVADARGFRVLRATGSESERTVPFGGLSQLLRPVINLLDSIPPVQAEGLAQALALRRGVSGDRFVVGAATLSVVCRAAESGPLLLAVDDLHLLDEPSLDALTFLAHRTGSDPVALVATARSAEADRLDRTLERLEVAGLPLADARQLVATTGSTAAAPELVARLHRATGGNPLALLELAADLAWVDTESPETPLTVSAAVGRAFAERATGLGPDASTLLLVGCVAGGDLRLTSAAAARLGLTVARLADAEAAQLLQITGERIEFRHPLVPSAIYAAATPEARRAAHRAVADALPAEASDRRAWHLADAALGVDDDVADQLEQAALNARSRWAVAVASSAYERSARLSQDDGVRARRLVTAAETACLAGSPTRANRLLDEVDDAAAGARVRRMALDLRGDLALRCGPLTVALRLKVAVADWADTDEERVRALADAIYACLYLGDARTALDLARRLEALDLDADARVVRAIARAAAGVARVIANAGGTEELRAAREDLATAGVAGHHERHVPWLMVVPLFLRDSDSGTELRARADELRREVAVGVLPFLLFNLARDDATSDRWSRAAATYAESVQLAADTGQTIDLAISRAGLAWLLARMGRDADCRALIEETAPIADENEVHLARMWLLYARGDLALGAGDAGGAVAAYGALEDLLTTNGFTDPDVSPAPDLVEALLRAGEAEQARRTALVHLDAARAKGRPWALARAHRAVASTGPDDDLDECFGRALAFHEGTRDGYERARTELAYGGRLRRARRRADARPHLRSALVAFEALGATTWADHTAAELAATGETVRRSTAPAVTALTPQELQVAHQLIQGRSTREVAAALFLSPKTVEYHLRKIYARLGIRSRGELADLLGPGTHRR